MTSFWKKPHSLDFHYLYLLEPNEHFQLGLAFFWQKVLLSGSLTTNNGKVISDVRVVSIMRKYVWT